MAVKKPNWLTIELLNAMEAEVDQHPSYQKYIQNSVRLYQYYHGHTDADEILKAVAGFDDSLGVDERFIVARINKIKEVVDKVGSVTMKNEPIVRRWPYHPEDADLADDLDALYLDAWDDTYGQDVARSIWDEARIAGMSIGKVIWDPANLDKSKDGEVLFTKTAPGEVKFDPYAKSYLRGRDARFIIHTTEHPAPYLAAKYGNEAEAAMGMRKDARGRRRAGGVANMLGAAGRTLIKSIKGEKGRVLNPPVTVKEYWIFPVAMAENDLSIGEDVTPDEYPYGLVVTRIEDKIVRVMKNPFVKRTRAERVDEYGVPRGEYVEVGHKRSPFVVNYWGRSGDRRGKGKYGIYDCFGMVEGMMSIQVNINALRQQIAINARTVANPPIVVNEDFVDGPVDNLTFTPSQVIKIKETLSARDAIQVLQGAQMPQFVSEMLQDEYREIESTVGVEPGVIGLFPSPAGGTSHTPALTIGALQESAFGPLWVRVAELAAFLYQTSELYDGLIQQKYKPGRYLATTKQGMATYVEFSNRHITASFKRRVVNGSTTPYYDLERNTRTAEIVAIVNQAIASQNPVILEVAMAHLDALGYPFGYQFQQILAKEHQRLLEMQQGLQALGRMGVQMGMQQPQEPDYAGLVQGLSAETGVDQGELVRALEL